MGLQPSMSFHSGRCPTYTPVAFAPCRYHPPAIFSGQHAAAVTMTRTCRLPACRLTFWQQAHFSWHLLLERASAFLYFRPWWFWDFKLYSWRRWNQRAVCPSMFLKLSSQVKVEWLLRRWNTCVCKHFWNYFSVFTIVINSLQVSL
jgi:hypothetical protein